MTSEDKSVLAVYIIMCIAIVAMVFFAATANREPSVSDLVKEGHQSTRCFEDELTVLVYEPRIDSISWVCVPWDNLFPRK